MNLMNLPKNLQKLKQMNRFPFKYTKSAMRSFVETKIVIPCVSRVYLNLISEFYTEISANVRTRRQASFNNGLVCWPLLQSAVRWPLRPHNVPYVRRPVLNFSGSWPPATYGACEADLKGKFQKTLSPCLYRVF